MIPSKIYFVVGEQSGDQHAADVIAELLTKNASTQIRGRGGDNMQNAGCELSFHYNKMALMGFTKVILNLGKIRKHLQEVEDDIRNFNPDVVIFVDYPGFNLRLASKLYQDFQLIYYIAPKVWAWNTKRVKKIEKYIDKVFSILPFEVEFFKKHGVDVTYVGNPSVAQVSKYQKNDDNHNENHLALLPGSRKQEIKNALPFMLESAKKLGMPFKISKAQSIEKEFYLQYIESQDQLVENMYDLLAGSSLAIVTSGTATLETALFNVPQVVCYKTDWFSSVIGKLVLQVPYISLVNLIVNKPIVKELIQEECTSKAITTELIRLKENRKSVLDQYKEVHSQLGELLPHVELVKQLES